MTAVADAVEQRRVVLIDLSSIYWSCWHATANESLSDAAKLTMTGIRRCYKDGDLVAICCDLGRSFRKDISAEYKANRPEKDQNSLGELARLKDRLRADGYLLWEAQGFEADDVIATAVRLSAPHEVLICSADKDLLQLLRPGVRALRTHSWTEGGADEVKAKFGVTPAQLVDYLSLVGDTSDNIAGAPGVGPKTAADLLTAHGSVDELYRAISQGKRVTTPARMTALIESAASVVLARDLVTLRDDAPIVWNEIYEERKPARLLTEEIEPMDTPFYDIPISNGLGQADVPASAEAPKPQTTSSPAVAQPEAKVKAAPQEATPAGALVRVPVVYEQALEPTSSDGAYKMAKLLYESRLYSRFSGPEAIFAVIVRGRELGLGALTALDSFHVIEGKPAPHAHLIVAMAEARPECEYFMLVSSSNKEATYETKNRNHPKPVAHTYRIEDAVDAGLCGLEIIPRSPGGAKDSRGNWDKRRAEMLRKTAAVQLVRIVYPSAAMGLYAAFELGGDE